MAALDGKGNLPLSLNTNASQGARHLPLECLDDVLRSRVFCLAVDPAKATADADILSYRYFSQLSLSFHGGGRQPPTAYYITTLQSSLSRAIPSDD
jgi:hypothetical protein